MFKIHFSLIRLIQEMLFLTIIICLNVLTTSLFLYFRLEDLMRKLNLTHSFSSPPPIVPDGGGHAITHFVAGRVVACEIENADGGGRQLRLTVEPCLLQTGTAILDENAESNPWIGKVQFVW